MRLSCSCSYHVTSHEIRWVRTNYEAICEMSSSSCRSCPFIPIIPFQHSLLKNCEALSFYWNGAVQGRVTCRYAESSYLSYTWLAFHTVCSLSRANVVFVGQSCHILSHLMFILVFKLNLRLLTPVCTFRRTLVTPSCNWTQ